MFDVRGIGARMQALRLLYSDTLSAFRMPRRQLWACESGRRIPTLAYLERFCAQIGISLHRFFDGRFYDTLVLEDPFCREVLPFLKRLGAKQKEEILRTMEAAPKTRAKRSWRRRSAPTSRETLNA